MSSLIRIVTLLIVSFVVVTLSTANSVNSQLSDEDFQTIVIVKDLESLKTLTREISQLQSLNADYDGAFNREIVKKSLEQAVNFEVPRNSYALIIRTKDEKSTEAIESKGSRKKRISGLIVVGTSLLAAVKDATSDDTKGTDPYGKQVLSAISRGLLIFSAGMAAVSLVPNPITPGVSVVSGALSLGFSVAKDIFY